LKKTQQGFEGWDEYAPFYDWENARTLGRRDVAFWRQFAAQAGGKVLELGCGTGRVSLQLARAGIHLVGVDRSAAMLERARHRVDSVRRGARFAHPTLVRGDIRALPFRRDSFRCVLAPYGVLQSLLADADLVATLKAIHRVLARGGWVAIDLVPDVPAWQEYENQVRLRGRAPGGTHLTLVESVQQDPRRRLTTFGQRYVVRRGRRRSEYRFQLVFRTVALPLMVRRLEGNGFAVKAVLGDYRGRPWHERAPVWIILARSV
jgi:ubiquinone/menaquinone biosynthesis C-methylase UbiE